MFAFVLSYSPHVNALVFSCGVDLCWHNSASTTHDAPPPCKRRHRQGQMLLLESRWKCNRVKAEVVFLKPTGLKLGTTQRHLQEPKGHLKGTRRYHGHRAVTGPVTVQRVDGRSVRLKWMNWTWWTLRRTEIHLEKASDPTWSSGSVSFIQFLLGILSQKNSTRTVGLISAEDQVGPVK